MRKILTTHELLLLGLIAVLCVGISLGNPGFLSRESIFDLLKSSVTIGIFALGALIVLLSGNIDISFPAISVFSMYVTCRLVLAFEFADHIGIVFGLAAVLGCLLGWLNAVFIHFFKLPGLIVTLGTQSLLRGFLLAFVGTRIITNLPGSMVEFSRASVFTARAPGGGETGLAVSVLLFLGITLFVGFLLHLTLPGRGIRALGGAPEAARRVGLSVGRLQFLIYGLTGLLAGVVGIIHASHMRNANPFDIVGIELTVIAAVVLGGASITGGKGRVTGTVLGVLLLGIIHKGLIPLGIPSQWDKVFVGVIILVSTGVTAGRPRRRRIPKPAQTRETARP